MIRKTITLTIVVLMGLCVAVPTQAQQDPIYSQYMFNPLALNPAYAGSKDALSMMLISRHQWVGFKGAPATQFIMAHTPVGTSNVGLGLNIINDKTGPVTQTGVYVDYSYRIKVRSNAYLSMGLKGGMNHMQNDISRLATQNPNPDPVQMEKIEYKNLLNIGAGIYFYTPRFYAGLSVPKLMENKFTDPSASINSEGKEVRHYYAMTGAVFQISDQVKLKPTLLLRLTQGTSPSTDVNLNALIGENLWVGVMYRISDSYGINLKYMITQQFYAGYAFDKNTNELKNYNNGTHEIMIGYDLTFKRRNVENPRYF